VSARETVYHLGDDDAHSEVWDDDRLGAFLDEVEQGVHAHGPNEMQDEYDLPYALYDGPAPPRSGGASLPATPHPIYPATPRGCGDGPR
jgi:hypothetical protein